MPKRSVTTKDVSTLQQLRDEGQLVMAPEFQRNSVWPRPAKAYLIDTILSDRPIPFLYFRRVPSAQTGRSTYEVIDGQQRLRSVFEYLDGRFALTETKAKNFHRKRFDDLTSKQKSRILSYDFNIEELTGYSDKDIRDMFVRMNRYVVKLSPQEIRHAKSSGKFAEFVEQTGKWDFWRDERIFTPHQLRRMRAVEFSAELAVLIIEGPQDKKATIDLYYGRYERRFPHRSLVDRRLRQYINWVTNALPNLRATRYRKPVDFYSIVGALEEIRNTSKRGSIPSPVTAGEALLRFDRQTRVKNPRGRAARYLAAASRQTDNIAPRSTRISILVELISGA